MGKSTLVNNLFLTDLYPERQIPNAAGLLQLYPLYQGHWSKVDLSSKQNKDEGITRLIKLLLREEGVTSVLKCTDSSTDFIYHTCILCC